MPRAKKISDPHGNTDISVLLYPKHFWLQFGLSFTAAAVLVKIPTFLEKSSVRKLCSWRKIVLIWPNQRVTTSTYLTYSSMHKACACFDLHWFFVLSTNHKISLESHTLCVVCPVTEPGKIQKCSYASLLGRKNLSVSIILEIFQPSRHFFGCGPFSIACSWQETLSVLAAVDISVISLLLHHVVIVLCETLTRLVSDYINAGLVPRC